MLRLKSAVVKNVSASKTYRPCRRKQPAACARSSAAMASCDSIEMASGFNPFFLPLKTNGKTPALCCELPPRAGSRKPGEALLAGAPRSHLSRKYICWETAVQKAALYLSISSLSPSRCFPLLPQQASLSRVR